jgi:hypothetical protein
MKLRRLLFGALASAGAYSIIMITVFLPDFLIILGPIEAPVILAVSVMLVAAFIAVEFVERFLDWGVKGLLEEARFVLPTFAPVVFVVLLWHEGGHWPDRALNFVYSAIVLIHVAFSYADRWEFLDGHRGQMLERQHAAESARQGADWRSRWVTLRRR